MRISASLLFVFWTIQLLFVLRIQCIASPRLFYLFYFSAFCAAAKQCLSSHLYFIGLRVWKRQIGDSDLDQKTLVRILNHADPFNAYSMILFSWQFMAQMAVNYQIFVFKVKYSQIWLNYKSVIYGLQNFYEIKYCGQFYKCSFIVNYDTSVVMARKCCYVSMTLELISFFIKNGPFQASFSFIFVFSTNS